MRLYKWSWNRLCEHSNRTFLDFLGARCIVVNWTPDQSVLLIPQRRVDDDRRLHNLHIHAYFMLCRLQVTFTSARLSSCQRTAAVAGGTSWERPKIVLLRCNLRWHLDICILTSSPACAMPVCLLQKKTKHTKPNDTVSEYAIALDERAACRDAWNMRSCVRCHWAFTMRNISLVDDGHRERHIRSVTK